MSETATNPIETTEEESQILATTTDAQSIPVEPILVDGMWIDPDTGEVVGEEEPIEDAALSEDQAERILERMLKHESRRSAAQIRAAHARELIETKQREALEALDSDEEYIALKAKFAQATDIESRAAKVIAFLEASYKSTLGDLAKRLLGMGKVRTWKFFAGDVSLRKMPANIEVTDEATAVKALSELGAKECIKQTIKKTELNKRRDEILTLELPGFADVPEWEKVTIDLKVA